MSREILPETRYELQQLRANAPFRFGLHLGETLAVGAAGIPVSEVSYDPARHQAGHIDPLAMMGALEGRGGRPYVTEKLPFRPLEMSVVLHRNPLQDDDDVLIDHIRQFKDGLAGELSDAIDGAMQIGDTNTLYVVGDITSKSLPRSAQRIRRTDRPEAAAKAIGEICAQGLTFVVSDFEALPLSRVRRRHFARTVVVKTNHKSELELPENIGVIPFDGLEDVNTHNPKKLKIGNEALVERHAKLERQLGRQGLAVARVVFDEQFSPCVNRLATDKSIAAAVRKLASR